ncbi:tripartite tricarboxylate transporter substrate binding protein [Ramlibacter sp. GTP1]|uniref:Tripartite tricarboxylate transporter substrate binding protein n=1 Tax=Ramlibacter albus TaxID=2079448 RepID=A0A923S5I1_9BURK|nr:tripartite tricarboxylate transporter substrate binding protein [Ramlibacter albus]
MSKILLAAACLAAQTQVHAAWPDKPIKLVVPYSAGGAADALARAVATELGLRLKQQVIIDNKPGAGGTIGAQSVATAPADGYTFLYDATSFAVNPSLYPKLPFNYGKDFVPVSMVARIPTLLVVPASSPFKTVADLVEYAKKNPAKLSYASAGNGGAAHLSGELFKQGYKISLVHIPYRGGAPALTDVAGGQVDMMFSAVTASGPMVKAGRLRVLATAFDKRLGSMPTVPTVAEAGLKGFSAYEWNAIFAPAGTPADVVKRMDAEMRDVLASPAMRERFATLGALPAAGGAKELGDFVSAESAKWATVIKTAQIKVD